MHKSYMPKNEENKLERLVFTIYAIHQISMLGVAVYLHWPGWLNITFVAALLVELCCFVTKYSNTHTRQMLYICLMEICLIMFSMYWGELIPILFPFTSIIVLVGLSGYSDLIFVTAIALVYLVIYHGWVSCSIKLTNFDDFLHYAIPIINVIYIQQLVYFWMRKRKETSQKMNQIIDTLKIAERSKDDFLANVSHEIRTPINTINGMSEVLLQDELGQKVRENVLNIQNAGRNLLSVVSDILDFSELQSKNVEIVEENYNLTSTINDIINMSMAQKMHKNLELIVDCDPNLPRGLMGDEKKIRRVVMNLINNAIKFTEEGEVGIKITFRKEFYGINLIFIIKDSGIGMSEESVSKLFTTYNQVDAGTSRQKGGVGLGLAISKAIVQKMGGVIMVKSKLGQGTSVHVTIPQKIMDERPIVELEDREKRNILIYTNMERIVMRSVRDDYSNALVNLGKNLGINSHLCRNFEEIRRRTERENYSNVFIGMDEYIDNPAFYDELCKKTRVAVVLDESEGNRIVNRNLILLYKPFYVIPFMAVLNGNSDEKEINDRSHKQGFVAPDVKILIVDDNVMNLRVVEGLLNRYKIKTAQALSGMEALDKIETKDYDLVFMDHMMPEMDGIETFHRIRQKGGVYYSSVPIVALTANAIAGAREMFLREGFNDFVEKPVDNSVLERVLERNLSEDKLIYLSGEKTVLNEQEVPVTEEVSAEKDQLVIGDLDVEKALTYCGGEDSYLAILREYAQNGSENWETIEEFFASEDWKNYTITVHGIKSSMLAIGAARLSEMAKKLELAGKENDLVYIRANHDEMIREYKRVIDEITTCSVVDVDVMSKNAVGELPALSEELFCERIAALENAMYDFDTQQMKEIVEELNGYSFHGVALKEQFRTVSHKIEMEDYMSAVETANKIKERLKKKEGE